MDLQDELPEKSRDYGSVARTLRRHRGAALWLLGLASGVAIGIAGLKDRNVFLVLFPMVAIALAYSWPRSAGTGGLLIGDVIARLGLGSYAVVLGPHMDLVPWLEGLLGLTLSGWVAAHSSTAIGRFCQAHLFMVRVLFISFVVIAIIILVRVSQPPPVRLDGGERMQ